MKKANKQTQAIYSQLCHQQDILKPIILSGDYTQSQHKAWTEANHKLAIIERRNSGLVEPSRMLTIQLTEEELQHIISTVYEAMDFAQDADILEDAAKHREIAGKLQGILHTDAGGQFSIEDAQGTQQDENEGLTIHTVAAELKRCDYGIDVDRAPAILMIEAIEQLKQYTRASLLELLQWNDSNGVFSDENTLEEFGVVTSKVEAICHIISIMVQDEQDIEQWLADCTKSRRWDGNILQRL